MLPQNFNLNHLDKGIKNLVITLNRIPYVETATTCEGHVWKDCLGWPTKNGWVYFYNENTKENKLINKIENFCGSFEIFQLNKMEQRNNFYTINALFEPHGGKKFRLLSKKEQEKYFERAEIRKKDILRGWNGLNSVIEDYIFMNITKDIKSLPYMKE